MQPQLPGQGPTPGQQPQPGYPPQQGGLPTPVSNQGPAPLPSYPAPSNANPSAYEFIVNPRTASVRKSPLASTSKPLLLIIIVLAVLLLGFGAYAMLGRSGNKNVAEYLSIAQQQAELQRLSQIAATQTTVSTDTKADALTTSLTVSTDANQLNAFLAKGGVKFDQKKIALGKDLNANKTLDAAAAGGNFDSAFNSLLIQKLQKYQLSLQQLYGKISSKSGKQILSDSYDHATLLVKQAKQASDSSD